MNTSRFQVGLVGAGHICPFHLEALLRIPDVNIVGIFDRDKMRAEEAVRRCNAGQAFASLEELLAAANVLHVLTPPSSHATLTLQACAAGCDVFVEKPLAPTADECWQIQREAEGRGRTVGVDHSLLMDPFTLQAQRLVAEGAVGQVTAVECIRSQDYPEYAGGPYPEYAREGGYPFRDLGIHALYQIEAFLGPIERMQWLLDRRGTNPLIHVDEWRVNVQCERGTAHVHLSWNVHPLQDIIIVQGTSGILQIDRFGMNVTLRKTRGLPEHPQRAFNALAESGQHAVQVPCNLAHVVTHRIRRYHGLQTMIARFYDALRDGSPPDVDPATAARIAHWVEQVASDADARLQQGIKRFERELSADTLVTGATGFIGGHLLRRLLKEGRRIRILCRRPPTADLLDHPHIEVVLGDLGHPETVDRAISGVDVVYHVGATVHGTETEFWRGSVVGTRNVVESCLRFGIKQLIYVSSLSVLQATGHGGIPADESAPLEPHPDRRGLYTQTKLAAEQIVLQAVRERSLPAAIVRPGEVVGAGTPLLSAGVGRRRGSHVIIFGNGELTLPLIHVQDLVDAMLVCEQRAIQDGSIFHLIDPRPVTQNQLAEYYGRLTGEPLCIHHVPRALVFAIGLAVQTVCWPLRRQPPVSVYRLRSALTAREFNISHAQHRLGWRPVRGVLQGLQETVRGPAKLVEPPRVAEVERVS